MRKLRFVETKEKTAKERKRELRQYVKAQRAILENRDVKETRLIENVRKALFLKMDGAGTKRKLFIYLSFSHEAPTDKLIEGFIEEGHIVFCPRIENGEMSAVEYGEDFTVSNLGIREPVGESYEGPLDVVILPTLAVDCLGNRLGYGGGYYDRFLQGKTALKIAYCYDCQLVKNVPREAWDEPVDVIVTEEKIIYARE